ncbi:polymorphic toxin type 50 domain-containing protein [Lacticaseibacillus paracasei]
MSGIQVKSKTANGYFVDVNRNWIPTLWGGISYSKGEAHITPLKPRKKA